VVAIAPVSDLTSLLGAAGGIPEVAGFAVMVAAGFHAAYPQLDFDALLTPEARTQLAMLETSCVGAVLQTYQALGAPAYAVDPRTTLPYDAVIVNNSPGRVKTDAPVLIVHGTDDAVVPLEASERFLPVLCGVGTSAELRPYAGAEHGSVLVAAGPELLSWIADRVARVPASDGCGAG